MSGYSGSHTEDFGPDDTITRGQIAVILWNKAGKPAPKKDAKSFPDVKSDTYYETAMK